MSFDHARKEKPVCNFILLKSLHGKPLFDSKIL